MPESPCKDCGAVIVLHTEDDLWPQCQECFEKEAIVNVILAISDGSLKVPSQYDEEGEPD